MNTTKIGDFVQANGLAMTATRVGAAGGDWGRGATEWQVTLRAERNGATMIVPFHMGSAHTDAPDLATVLDCLALDSAGFENATGFADWADEYGFDSDSIKALRTYEQVEEQAHSLRALLGQEAYDELLFCTERL
jgi:hypothetical protein